MKDTLAAKLRSEKLMRELAEEMAADPSYIRARELNELCSIGARAPSERRPGDKFRIGRLLVRLFDRQVAEFVTAISRQDDNARSEWQLRIEQRKTDKVCRRKSERLRQTRLISNQQDRDRIGERVLLLRLHHGKSLDEAAKIVAEGSDLPHISGVPRPKSVSAEKAKKDHNALLGTARNGFVLLDDLPGGRIRNLLDVRGLPGPGRRRKK